MKKRRRVDKLCAPIPDAYRILHFTLGPSFDGKFLFHPALNEADGGVHYFAIGQSGYLYDRAALVHRAAEYWRALLLLIRGVGTTNQRTTAYCHTTKFALPGLLLCRIFGVGEVIYFNHGVPYAGHQGLMKWVLHMLERANIAAAHHFITVSPEMVRLMQPLSSESPWAHSTRPGSSSGLREADFTSLSAVQKRAHSVHGRGVRYLYAGRLQARKGVFVLLEAWKAHTVQFPADELWLCGFSAEELSIHYALDTLSQVRIHGYMTKMDDIYNSVDVVVSPSFHEGFGYTLLEGAARGCCILSSAVPGPDIMFTPWMRSLLFKAGDVEALGSVMGKLSSSATALAVGRCLSYRSARRFAMHKISYPRNTQLN